MHTIDDVFGYLAYCKNQDIYTFDTKDQAEFYAHKLKEVIASECFERRPVIVVEGTTVVMYLTKLMQQPTPKARPAVTKQRNPNEVVDEAQALYEELDNGGSDGPRGPAE